MKKTWGVLFLSLFAFGIQPPVAAYSVTEEARTQRMILTGPERLLKHLEAKEIDQAKHVAKLLMDAFTAIDDDDGFHDRVCSGGLERACNQLLKNEKELSQLYNGFVLSDTLTFEEVKTLAGVICKHP